MKKLNSYLLLGAMIFCLSTLLTSCDEIFGEGDNPVPVIPPSPVVDEAKVLGAALEAGAIVSVTYNVGSTTYVATFVKNSDDSYTLQSNAKISAARALTRGVSDPTVTVGDGATVGDLVQLLLSGNKLKLVVKAANGNPLFEATMNIETGEIAIINTNAKGVNCTIGSFAVNGDTKDIKNPEMQNVTVNFAHTLVVPATSISLSLTFNYAVQYLNGETWADVIARYKACDHGEISTTDDDFISITFRKDIATEVIKAAVSTLDYNVAVLVTPDKIEELATAVSQTKLYLYTQEPVRSADVVDGNKTYVLSLQAPVTYKKGAWDDTEKKVVFTNEIAIAKVVQNASASVTWSDGWYTVSGNVTITGDVFLGADTHLILQDGVLFRPADLMEFLVRFYRASGVKSALRLCARLRADSFDWTTALHTFQQSIPLTQNETEMPDLFFGIKPDMIEYDQKERLINHLELLADGVRYSVYAGIYSGHNRDLSAGQTVDQQPGAVCMDRSVCGPDGSC